MVPPHPTQHHFPFAEANHDHFFGECCVVSATLHLLQAEYEQH